MEIYYEHSVASQNTPGKNALYALCWAMVVLLVVAAVAFAAGIIANDPNALRINWLNLVGLAVCLALALLLFRRKDTLRMEYDYLLDNDTLEICGIYNKRRRRCLANINIARLKSAGPADGSRFEALKHQQGVKAHAWYGEKATHFLYYAEDNITHLALLQLDEKLAELVRRQLPVGAWQDKEGK